MKNKNNDNKMLIRINKLDENKKKTFVDRTWISIFVIIYYVLIILFSFLGDNTIIAIEVIKWPILNEKTKSIFAFIYVFLIYFPFVFSIYEINKLILNKNKKTYIALLIASSILFLGPNIFYILSDYFDLKFLEFNSGLLNDSTEIKFRDLNKLRLFFGTIFIGMITTFVVSNICCVLLKKNNAQNVITLNFLMFIVPFGFTSFAIAGLIRSWITLLYLFLSVIFIDGSCYLVGILFGKTKMSPVISPNKTWEGAIGGTIISIVLILSLCGLFEIYKPSGNKENEIIQMIAIIHSDVKLYNWIWIVFTSIALLIVSIIGDLFFSYIKRKFNIKDYSNILKSHGGILDRVDSQIFVSSTYVILLFITSSMVDWSLL